MTYGLCAWCRAGHMTPANWCTELTLLSEAESFLNSSPFRLRGSRAAHVDSACKHKSSQKSQAPEAPIASLDKSYEGGGMWPWGWSAALFCPLKQNAGDSRHLRSISPGLWQHTSHWAAACIPVFNGGNASAASTPHLPTGLSFDSTVGGRKANLWEGKAKQK